MNDDDGERQPLIAAPPPPTATTTATATTATATTTTTTTTTRGNSTNSLSSTSNETSPRLDNSTSDGASGSETSLVSSLANRILRPPRPATTSRVLFPRDVESGLSVNFDDDDENDNDNDKDHADDDDGDDDDGGKSDDEKLVVSLDHDEAVGVLLTIERIESELEGLRNQLRGLPTSGHKPKANPFLKPWLINNMLLISTVLQVVLMVAIHFITPDNTDTDDPAFYIGMAIMLVVEGLQLGFCILTSVKLVKQMMHRTASLLFLAQSYLTTCVLFAGIYTVIVRVCASAFEGLIPAIDQLSTQQCVFVNQLDSSLLLIEIFFRMLYFSIVTQSTLGYGDIHPAIWYSDLVVTVQILLGVLYSCFIFARGLQELALASGGQQLHALRQQQQKRRVERVKKRVNRAANQLSFSGINTYDSPVPQHVSSSSSSSSSKFE